MAGPGGQRGSSAAPQCQHSLEELTVTAVPVLLSKLLFYLSPIPNDGWHLCTSTTSFFFLSFFLLCKRSDRIGLLSSAACLFSFPHCSSSCFLSRLPDPRASPSGTHPVSLGRILTAAGQGQPTTLVLVNFYISIYFLFQNYCL